MQTQELKLKQASAVLEIEPKDLQNLVQFGIVKPRQLAGIYFFDTNALLGAKVAFCLKAYLGTPTGVLAKLMDTFRASANELKAQNPKYIVFQYRFSLEEDPIKLSLPFRAVYDQLQKRMKLADLYRDIPPGRKRRGWKKDFLESLAEAAKDIGEISEEEILRTVRTYRRERRAPEITVAAEK